MKTTHDCFHMYSHDRIEVCGDVCFSLLGKFATEYASGPNLLELADHVQGIVGKGSYGMKSCRKSGFFGSSGLGWL